MVADIPFIAISIFSNNPGPPYSQPLEPLWTRTFTPDQFIIAGPWTGYQGWLEPYGDFYLHDHVIYYQINIKNITDPFMQEKNAV